MRHPLSAFELKRNRRSAGPYARKVAVLIAAVVALVLIPSGSANAAPDDFDPSQFLTALSPAAGMVSLIGDECKGPGLPPETYGSGFDGLAAGTQQNAPRDWSFYGQYGTAGQYWNWVEIGCTDVLTKTGNQAANLVFNFAKTLDTVTITVYKAAASESMISWLKNVADKLIGSIGHALQFRYLMPVVMLGALALIWWGLFKRRATKVTEGTIWMVCATVALMALIGKPEIFTTAGSAVTTATDNVVNAAIDPVKSNELSGATGTPNGRQANSICVPTKNPSNPQYTGKWTDTDENANTMWSVLVCKPWLQGEFGTADPNSRVVKDLSYNLLVSQAFTENDVRTKKVTDQETNNKQKTYMGVAQAIKTDSGNDQGSKKYPQASYDLFNGKQYTQRIGIAFAALFAAIAAGLLILLLSLALIIFKLGFLLLLVTGPFFLLIGVHPGWGRVIAVRWIELLLSTLLKQALVAGILALLLFFYSLIMSSGSLSWVLQIVLIALVSFAAFFYRKPFQHLFAAVGTDSIGSRILSNATAGTNAFKTGAAPLTAPQRVNRWALRKAQPLTDAAGATGHPAGMAVALGSRMATGNATDDDVSGRTAGRISAAANQKGDGSGPSTGTTAGNRRGTNAPPLNLPRPGESHSNGPNGAGGPGTTPRGGVRPGGGPTTVGPRPGANSGNAPAATGAGWGPRSGEAPPMWKPSSSSGTPPRNAPTPTGSGGGSGSRSGAGGWSGSSWRRSGGASAAPSGPNGPKPPKDGGSSGPRRTGGGGWFGGGSKRDGGTHDPAPPPPRRTEKRDTGSGPAPWRKRDSAPPLWAKPSKPPAPDIPFWTRPDK